MKIGRLVYYQAYLRTAVIYIKKFGVKIIF